MTTASTSFVFDGAQEGQRLLVDFGLPDCAVAICISWHDSRDGSLVVSPWTKLQSPHEVAGLASVLVGYLVESDFPGEVVEQWEGLVAFIEHLADEFKHAYGLDDELDDEGAST